MYNDGIHLGEFEVTSGRLRVTDPCYNKDTWCAGVLDVLNGTWGAFVETSDEGGWGVRVASINIFNKEYEHKAHSWSLTNIDVGVDSGQAGFFDDAKYPEDPHQDDAFYDSVCDLTLGPNSGGVLPFGAVSSSGYGDGGYSCYVSYVNGEIVAAKIVFIGDESEEEEDDYCD